MAADASTATPAKAAGPSDATAIGELVVVAEKRAEKLETTPVAISAYTAAQRDLLGIASVQDLTDFTPGLSYSTFDNRPYLRGVGRQTDNLAVESGVAVYVDGVYNGANASTILQSDTLFVDSIEVLRGPQSTLYGRNADGGAINYVSKKPTREFKAEARTGVDSYGKWFGEAAASGPIADWLRYRVAGNYTQQDGGYYKNLTGAREGGSVAQGGNGKSHHIEVQFDGNLGDKLDFWVKAGTADYSTSYHTETQIGPLDTREFSNALFPNQNFGLCALPGGSGGLGCAVNHANGTYDTIVPGSVVALPGTLSTNPSDVQIRNFQADQKSNANEGKDALVAASLTWHAPGFDVKYLFGYQTFAYRLTAPWVNSQGVSSSVESYQLAGPGGSNLTIFPGKTNFTFDEFENFSSHELAFTSTNPGPLQWLAGLYYYHEYYNQPINVNDPSQPQVRAPMSLGALLGGHGLVAAPLNPTGSSYNEYTALNEDSVAAYAQADWQMTPTLKFTGGVRYSNDFKVGYEAFRVILFNASAFGIGVGTFGANTPAFDATSCSAAVFVGAGPCSINASGAATRSLEARWDSWTGTANLAWTPDSDTLAYAKYSRGYKTGGFNSGTMAANPETGPETVDAFEVGYKKTLGHTFQANASAFYYLYYNDQQPLGITNATSGVTSTQIYNIPEVHAYGLELESLWSPVRDLTLSLNYSYLHSTISSTNGQCLEDTADPTASAVGANTMGCPAAVGGIQLQNIVGASIAEAPKHKVSLNGLYKIRFDQGVLSLSGTFVWKAKEYSSPFNRSYNTAPSYDQVNLRATWTDSANRYSVIAYCNNLFDTLGYDSAGGVIVNTSPAMVDRLASLTAPRTLGVEFQYRFK